jgi:hypothetical protein
MSLVVSRVSHCEFRTPDSAAQGVPSLSILDLVDFAASEPFREEVFGASGRARTGDEVSHQPYNSRDHQRDEQKEHDQPDTSSAAVVTETVSEAAPAVAVIVGRPTHDERDAEDDQPDDERGQPGRDVESAWSLLGRGLCWAREAFVGHVGSKRDLHIGCNLRESKFP